MFESFTKKGIKTIGLAAVLLAPALNLLIATAVLANGAKLVLVDTAPDPAASLLNRGPVICDPPDSAVDNPDRAYPMVLAWDKWHKLLADEVYERFNQSAQLNFKHSPPLQAKISYMVASDGRIGNVRVLEPSSNAVYNTMLITVIKSMAGDSLLAFPAGSKRMFVEKSGTFTWNKNSGGVDCQPEPQPQIGPKMLAK